MTQKIIPRVLKVNKFLEMLEENFLWTCLPEKNKQKQQNFIFGLNVLRATYCEFDILNVF